MGSEGWGGGGELATGQVFKEGRQLRKPIRRRSGQAFDCGGSARRTTFALNYRAGREGAAAWVRGGSAGWDCVAVAGSGESIPQGLKPVVFLGAFRPD